MLTQLVQGLHGCALTALTEPKKFITTVTRFTDSAEEEAGSFNQQPDTQTKQEQWV